MLEFLKLSLAAAAGIVILILAILIPAALIGALARKRRRRVRKGVVLEIDLDKEWVETVIDDSVSRFMRGRKPVLRDLVESLERAAGDSRVAGVVARIGSNGLSWADAQEVRTAVARFRESGKFALAWAETLGEGVEGMKGYYLASAFERIYLQPGGDLAFTGFASQAPFIRRALERLGVEPQLSHREEYKTFMNLFTEERFTEAHRESVESILDGIASQVVEGVASDRKLDASRVRELMDEAVFSAPDALDAGLVDGLKYRDEVYAEVRERVGGKPEASFLFAEKYLERAGRPNRKGKSRIALIYGVGGIQQGRSHFRPGPNGGPVMGSQTVSEAIRKAVRDEKVKAIVLRVHSPGGSAVASETVWRELRVAREAGKKVVASMGGVAGSGGYYVAVAADRIIAQPATITGSIGVVGGKMAVTGFWEKVGVSWDEAKVGKNADYFSITKPYSEEQRRKLERSIDRVYEDFTGKVAECRGLTRDEVLTVAKGRIWTGRQAIERKLVDVEGGLNEAIEEARRLAEIPEGEKFQVKVYPEKRPLARRLKGGADSSEQPTAFVAAIAEVVFALRDLVRAFAPVSRGLRGNEGAPKVEIPGSLKHPLRDS